MVDGAGTLELDGPAAGHDEIACPHCGEGNERPGRAAGTIIDCRHCSRSYAIPRPSAFERTRAEARETALGDVHLRSPTDIGLRKTGPLAAAITGVFYLTVVTPLSGTYFGDLFAARGWVPYVIAWLSAWAGLLLGAKAVLLASQRRALEFDLLPDALATRITTRNAESFRRHLRDLAARELTPPVFHGLLGRATERSFLVERLERALEYFRMRGSASDVLGHLGNQAQLDANAVESSYTMVRVFIWAIPLLGFIGTVLGISEAVAGFSNSVAEAVDLEVMKQSIGSVTTGLGVAFDTTLLALVMSIFIMFPTSSLQKAEEDFLDRVEAYCGQRLGRRLESAGTEANGAARPEALEANLSRLADALGVLDERLERVARSREGDS